MSLLSAVASTGPWGPFASSMDLLSTGLLDSCGITQIAIAGHPEGSPDFSDDIAVNALKLKREFAERTNADRLRIVPQFGFDPGRFIAWAEGLALSGIDLPVHIGVSGPAQNHDASEICRPLRGRQLHRLSQEKRAVLDGRLQKANSPEGVVGPIERHWRANTQGPIHQIHVFPFGGLQNSADWLVQRGSWKRDPTAHALSPDSMTG